MGNENVWYWLFPAVATLRFYASSSAWITESVEGATRIESSKL